MTVRTPAPVLLRHPSSLEHDTGDHPERAERLRAIDRAVAARPDLGWEARDSPAATDAQLTAVHPPAHVAGIRALSARGGGWIDGDTYCGPQSFAAAAHAAGGACALVDALLGEGRPTGAALHRPPGHHAEVDRAMGFCLFSTVAVAARHARDAHGLERVMVLDWDVHHGNGTEDVFRDSAEVLFVSIHESPLYPGTGPASEIGRGPGEGYTVNLPVPGGSGDAAFTSLVEHVALPLARAYRPQLLLVSAGYDAHADDPLAGCRVSDDGFATMTGSVRRLADELAVPLGLVLEGGYDVAALARCVVGSLEVLGADQAPPAPAIDEHPLAQAARTRLAPHWPALG
ncbi:histone deacetylase [Conexibacter sp. W3-3-2]|uniref:histone deacetylase family protein n=1 Tax=Conexibacter sp. W3-3-2 TaxID=2675227 RepID=UPI0012B9E2C0|nr:histone deacetylase [Conexibacter sp. W3-3-2]